MGLMEVLIIVVAVGLAIRWFGSRPGLWKVPGPFDVLTTLFVVAAGGVVLFSMVGIGVTVIRDSRDRSEYPRTAEVEVFRPTSGATGGVIGPTEVTVTNRAARPQAARKDPFRLSARSGVLDRPSTTELVNDASVAAESAKLIDVVAELSDVAEQAGPAVAAPAPQDQLATTSGGGPVSALSPGNIVVSATAAADGSDPVAAGEGVTKDVSDAAGDVGTVLGDIATAMTDAATVVQEVVTGESNEVVDRPSVEAAQPEKSADVAAGAPIESPTAPAGGANSTASGTEPIGTALGGGSAKSLDDAVETEVGGVRKRLKRLTTQLPDWVTNPVRGSGTTVLRSGFYEAEWLADVDLRAQLAAWLPDAVAAWGQQQAPGVAFSGPSGLRSEGVGQHGPEVPTMLKEASGLTQPSSLPLDQLVQERFVEEFVVSTALEDIRMYRVWWQCRLNHELVQNFVRLERAAGQYRRVSLIGGIIAANALLVWGLGWALRTWRTGPEPRQSAV